MAPCASSWVRPIAEELVDVRRAQVVLLHQGLSDCGWRFAAFTRTKRFECKLLKSLGDESFVNAALRLAVVLHPDTVPVVPLGGPAAIE